MDEGTPAGADVAGPAPDDGALARIRAARRRIRGSVLRTPLVRWETEETPADPVFLKLENLQPTGSFKVRGALNALGSLRGSRLARGVYTCSAGNMAQALAWAARRRGIPCTAVMPESAPRTKVEGVRRWGAEVIQVPFSEVWEIARTGRYEPLGERTFVHPFRDEAMIAGNGTVGLEIAEDCPDVATVFVPFGGGGLAAGIARALRTVAPRARVFAVEPETAAPLRASWTAGGPRAIERTPSFVDGAGGASVFPEMWERLRPLLAGAVTVSVAETAEAVRLLLERQRVVAEGAAGLSLAAARAGKAGPGPTVCVVSGGNIDPSVLVPILEGRAPDGPA